MDLIGRSPIVAWGGKEVAVPVLIWLLIAALYVLLGGQLSKTELATAPVVATVSVAWAMLLRRAAHRRYAFSGAQLAPSIRAIVRLVPDTLRSGAVLLRTALLGGSPGRALSGRFRFGASDDPRERARRVGAVTAVSLSPASFVVDLPRGRDEVLLHTILAGAPPPHPEWLA